MKSVAKYCTNPVHHVTFGARLCCAGVDSNTPLIPTNGKWREAKVKATQEVGERPNTSAAALLPSGTRILGVVARDMHNPFFAEVVDGIREAAHNAGYRILITTGLRRPEVEVESIETFRELSVDGIIIASPLVADTQLDSIGETIPMVAVGRELESTVLDSVHTDEYLGARLAVEHLQSLGHRDIAHIDMTEGAENTSTIRRRAGYCDAMRDAGLTAFIRSARAGPEHDGGAAFRRILDEGRVPTALFVYNDVAALAAQNQCVRSGFQIPEDISLVGYDNTFLADLEHVSLTSVDQQARYMGRLAVQFILERFKGRTSPRHEIVTPTLVARDSTARHSIRERRAALTLQHSLLPRGLAAGAALAVVSRYLPANAPSSVGGDWFDVIPLSGARVALAVGDVVGHGTNAAAAMGLLRTAVRTLAALDLPPDELLAHLDDLVISLGEQRSAERAVESEQHVVGTNILGATCLYAIYDPVTESCTLARAGHPPPAIVATDGTVTFLDLPAGPPLGLGFLPFGSVELELPEGALLALFTIGLVRAAEWEIDVGLSRLAEALACPGPTLDDVCDNVVSTMMSGSPPHDAALLVARARGLNSSQVATWDLISDPTIVASARGLTSRKLTEWGLEELQFTTELIVSELVTNAIRYGSAPIRLRLIHQHSLICEVSDASSTSPRMRHARTTDEGGRGLLIVARLTQRWGTRYTATGKIVWAECAMEAS
ncbi:SpoIIE family protein phosphatase [Streptomyces sp. NBS 14/10]|uniref:SpoIIE family protein phosphatase n=1 Tax=Streptomyces sp. NBS 14/10 TaxID=1945643 RepID=UPI000B7EE02E|nr:SpoIIE family protein phosphatase [Streptomyces sp. NBS 14/10]KAK1176674.1 SpoIIE family protein phosphatase [Streptomyces sp. NBS 14/10]